jgi:prophage regulatory protein
MSTAATLPRQPKRFKENSGLNVNVKSSPEPQLDRLLRTKEVVSLLGVTRVTLWRMERSGRFPARRRLTSSTPVWLASEVDAWVKQLQPVSRPTD